MPHAISLFIILSCSYEGTKFLRRLFTIKSNQRVCYNSVMNYAIIPLIYRLHVLDDISDKFAVGPVPVPEAGQE
jgi:hypothetical protein